MTTGRPDEFGTQFASEPKPRLTHLFTPTTNTFMVHIIRPLEGSETDPEVGPMFEIALHAYGDELEEIDTPPSITADGLLDRLQDLLYPLNEDRDAQWNGGDVCAALSEILSTYRPEAQYRQRGEKK